MKRAGRANAASGRRQPVLDCDHDHQNDHQDDGDEYDYDPGDDYDADPGGNNVGAVSPS